MRELLRLYTQIALLKRGPQDVPASASLLIGTVLAYFAVSVIVMTALGPIPLWREHLILGVVFMLAWYAVVLRLAKKPERYLQTMTAMFGYQIVLAPLMLTVASLLYRFKLGAPTAESPDSPLVLPLLMVAIGAFVWEVAAGARVLRSALEWSTPPSVALFILQTLALQLIAYPLLSTPQA